MNLKEMTPDTQFPDLNHLIKSAHILIEAGVFDNLTLSYSKSEGRYYLSTDGINKAIMGYSIEGLAKSFDEHFIPTIDSILKIRSRNRVKQLIESGEYIIDKANFIEAKMCFDQIIKEDEILYILLKNDKVIYHSTSLDDVFDRVLINSRFGNI